jgi:hypothetical protein
MTLTEQKTGYIVVTNDPGHSGVKLFMVDRNLQQNSFWSYYITEAFVYGNEEAAKEKAASYTFGEPHVLTWSEAREAQSNNLRILAESK